MRRKTICLSIAMMAAAVAFAQQTVTVTLKNNLKCELNDVPATVSLKEWPDTKSATVVADGKEIPYQIDDLDKDGNADELCFLTNLKGRETKTVTVTLSDKTQAREWTPRTFAEIVLRNPSVKEEQARHIPVVYNHRQENHQPLQCPAPPRRGLRERSDRNEDIHGQKTDHRPVWQIPQGTGDRANAVLYHERTEGSGIW